MTLHYSGNRVVTLASSICARRLAAVATEFDPRHVPPVRFIPLEVHEFKTRSAGELDGSVAQPADELDASPQSSESKFHAML